jgi:hypothetical protein
MIGKQAWDWMVQKALNALGDVALSAKIDEPVLVKNGFDLFARRGTFHIYRLFHFYSL